MTYHLATIHGLQTDRRHIVLKIRPVGQKFGLTLSLDRWMVGFKFKSILL